jgi:hypothetical protein
MRQHNSRIIMCHLYTCAASIGMTHRWVAGRKLPCACLRGRLNKRYRKPLIPAEPFQPVADREQLLRIRPYFETRVVLT